MRIAFISLMYDAPWGGSEVLWSQTAARALAEGHEVLLTTHSWPKPAPVLQRLITAGAQFYHRPRYQQTLRFRAKNWLSRLPRRGRLPEIETLRRFCPDVVLVSQGGWNDLLFHKQLASWLEAIPFILICHSYHDPVQQSENQRHQMVDLFARARQVLFISELQSQIISRQLATALPNARIAQNPLNLPPNWPVPYPSLLADTVIQLAVVGSFFTNLKGQDVLLDVLRAPLWQNQAWHLNLYGEGPDRPYLERLIKFYGLQDRVTLHGHVDDSSIIWSNTHLLILPSRIESGPMVVQEALLCGRPVLAAAVGLVREWVQDEKTGFIADTSSAISLSRSLERAWSRRTEWESMGQAGSAWARQHMLADPAADLLSHLLATAEGRKVEHGGSVRVL